MQWLVQQVRAEWLLALAPVVRLVRLVMRAIRLMMRLVRRVMRLLRRLKWSLLVARLMVRSIRLVPLLLLLLLQIRRLLACSVVRRIDGSVVQHVVGRRVE